MEIVSIERKTFEAMVAKFDHFVSRMDAICHRHGEKKMSEWMDNQDVCRMLNISPRTLQTLRDNGTLAYSQIKTTRRITVPKTWGSLSPLWRIEERKRSSKERLYELNIMTTPTKSRVI